MGYYRCESVERELAAGSQPYATNRAFCSSCGRDAVGLFPSAGPAVIGNNEIRGSRAFIGKPLRERGIRSISELLSSLSFSYYLAAFSPVSPSRSLAARHDARNRRTRYLKERALAKEGAFAIFPRDRQQSRSSSS